MARLTTFVHVQYEGDPHVFGPDDELPSWAEEQITNPDVWDESEGGAPASDGPPPKAGRGSSAKAWAEYLSRHGLAHDSNASRDDLIAAAAAAGLATE